MDAGCTAGHVSGTFRELTGDVAGSVPADRRMSSSEARSAGLWRAYRSARIRCMKDTDTDPSPTADATRFTDSCRASPEAKTPGTLVSSM